MKAGKLASQINIEHIIGDKDVVTKEYVDQNLNYTNLDPTPEDVGGIEAGSTFNDLPQSEMWDRLLYPYQHPGFDSFTFGWVSIIEVGSSTPANPTATWSTSEPTNIEVNSIFIRDEFLGANIATGLANDGTEVLTLTSKTRPTPGTYTFSINGINTTAEPFSRDLTVDWKYKVYYGASASSALNSAAIVGLDLSELSDTFESTYNLGAGNYKYICYPTSFGTAVKFLDVNTGFAIPFEAPVVVSVSNSFGVTANYNVHRSTNMMGSTLEISVS